MLFSDPSEPLPFALHDSRTQRVDLSAANLQPSLVASCSIPFWLDAVHDIPGAPRGAYWDGGITDYHLHLDCAQVSDGLVLYPHVQCSVVPGWRDKGLTHRHAATARLANVVLHVPSAEWIKAALPLRKLPDRGDFKAYGDDLAGRQKAWRRAVAESQHLADEFAALVQQPSIEALALPCAALACAAQGTAGGDSKAPVHGDPFDAAHRNSVVPRRPPANRGPLMLELNAN